MVIKDINCEVMRNIKFKAVKSTGVCVLAAAMILSLGIYGETKVFADEDMTVETQNVEVLAENGNTETDEIVTSEDNDVESEEITESGSTINTVTTIKKTSKSIKVNAKIKLKKLKAFKNLKMSSFTYKAKNRKVAKVSKSGVITGLKPGKTVVTVKQDGATYAKIKVNVKNRYQNSQLRLLSSLIFCEANTESYAGKKAVGIVTVNRVESSLFPSTLKNVVYQRGQYTPAATGFLASALRKYDNGTIPGDCIKAAKEALNGSKTVNIGKSEVNMQGFLFFSRYVPNKKLQIGAHQFK